ncbi:hypothetical protein OsI_13402 [Oryza sativa Indica Group]|uniref:Uncharacterized protein n=1 Tax=Oryza sativa subsp. indica TaxID=39946 RepID=A2XLP9_ORYSI|nr:hypothetical protein OsI_13402 [Oryza sativa Indica Group]
MALTNFVLTVAAVGAAALLFTTDIRKSGAMFRRNARQIRAWLEEESASTASRSAKDAPPKKLNGDTPKEKPKEDGH